jgi:hypothetical protein
MITLDDTEGHGVPTPRGQRAAARGMPVELRFSSGPRGSPARRPAFSGGATLRGPQDTEAMQV